MHSDKLEQQIARVVQSVNEWDDRTSPDDYPEHLLITSEELADILRSFANAVLAVEFTALQWRKGYCDERVTIEQASFGWMYQVRVFDGVIYLDWPDRTASVFETIDAAKVAAQKDFEQRIRSAMKPNGDVDG